MVMPPWWEKTVEYAFVLEMQDHFDFAMPLDGVPEKEYGDAIFGSVNRLILVEFKRHVGSLDSERNKYPDFDTAMETLKKSTSRHHFFVYGEGSKGQPITLQASGYLERNPVALLEMFDAAIDLEAFQAYAADLARLRNATDDEGGETIGAHHMSRVFGLAAEKRAKSGAKSAIVSMSLDTYLTRMRMRHEPRNNSRPTP